MNLWQWIVLFFFYAGICVGLGELFGFDPMYAFVGIPIIVIVFIGFVMISAIGSAADKKKQKPKDLMEPECRKLEQQILQEMNVLKGRSELPSKKVIARVQKLGNLARQQELEKVSDFDVVINILTWGIQSIDSVYVGKDIGMGETRKLTILGYLEKTCRNIGRDVPIF